MKEPSFNTSCFWALGFGDFAGAWASEGLAKKVLHGSVKPLLSIHLKLYRAVN